MDSPLPSPLDPASRHVAPISATSLLAEAGQAGPTEPCVERAPVALCANCDRPLPADSDICICECETTCQACDGTGEIEVSRSREPDDVREVPCPACTSDSYDDRDRCDDELRTDRDADRYAEQYRERLELAFGRAFLESL